MLQGKAMVVTCTNSSIPNWVKIPLNKAVSVADHTYVEYVPNGKTWGCHGRSLGGKVISSGAGCETNADCLYGNDEASIKYLVTGVCHQIANRTLTSAEITVHKAKCYFLSSATYGEYGLYRANWLVRRNQCNIPGHQGTRREYVYRALIAKRTSLRKNSVPNHEIDRLFPMIEGGLKKKLKKLTTDWKLQFLEHAIHNYKNQNFQQFYNHVHVGLNKYAKDCAEIMGYEAMADLLALEHYDERDYILLYHPENES